MLIAFSKDKIYRFDSDSGFWIAMFLADPQTSTVTTAEIISFIEDIVRKLHSEGKPKK